MDAASDADDSLVESAATECIQESAGPDDRQRMESTATSDKKQAEDAKVSKVAFSCFKQIGQS